MLDTGLNSVVGLEKIFLMKFQNNKLPILLLNRNL